MGLRDINAIRLVAIESGELLAEETVAVRVAAMPPRELLNSPPEDHCASLLPPSLRTRLPTEADTAIDRKRYVGPGGDAIGMDDDGASVPGPVAYEKFRFSVPEIALRARFLLERSS